MKASFIMPQGVRYLAENFVNKNILVCPKKLKILTRMKTLDGGDRIDEISVANSAHDVRIERGQADVLALPFPLLPLVDLGLYGAGGPLDGRRHLHPILVLQRRRTRRSRLLLHCLWLALESIDKIR